MYSGKYIYMLTYGVEYLQTENKKNGFMHDGAKLSNSIPKDIRERKSLSSFRHKIAAHTYEL